MHFGWLLALSYLGAFTHPLLDWQTTYSVQLLSPFSNAWYHSDSLFIIDLVLKTLYVQVLFAILDGVIVLVGTMIAMLWLDWRLTVVSLVIPAFRALRIFRAFRILRLARATRGAALVRVVGSINRSMRALGRTFGRRGSGYVAALTVVVLFAGAAGMLAFDSVGPVALALLAVVGGVLVILTNLGFALTTIGARQEAQ